MAEHTSKTTIDNVLIGLGLLSAGLTVGMLVWAIVDVPRQHIDLLTALKIAAASLFGLAVAQAAIFVNAAPMRRELVEDAGQTAEVLSQQLAGLLRPDQNHTTLTTSIGTVARSAAIDPELQDATLVWTSSGSDRR